MGPVHHTACRGTATACILSIARVAFSYQGTNRTA